MKARESSVWIERQDVSRTHVTEILLQRGVSAATRNASGVSEILEIDSLVRVEDRIG